MPHIHTQKGQHDLTASAFIVRTDTSEPRALVHMHKKHHMLMQVGGHVELHENPWQAIAHELEEESGYRLSQLMVLQPLPRLQMMPAGTMHAIPLTFNTHYIPNDHYHIDVEYGFVATGDPELAILEGESMDLRWLTLAELQAVPITEIAGNVLTIYEYLIQEALKSWEQVPTSSFSLLSPVEY